MIRMFCLFIIINSFIVVECQAGDIMDKCSSKPWTNDTYACISEESTILNKRYEKSFKNLLIKIESEKKFVTNYTELKNDLFLSKKKWESWIDSECLT
ncbi:lysozyme inhibitor LprI family protein, partial [Rosenbergiella collisarenosi]